MGCEIKIVDFPKIKSPYVRKYNEAGRYVVTSDIQEDFEWIFEGGVRAVDKLHGTNVCVHIERGTVAAIDNRDTRIVHSPYLRTSCSKKEAVFYQAVINSIERGWMSNVKDGAHYGEIIGPTLNKNIHQVPSHYFVPFSYLHDKCHWHSWVQNKYPKTFEAISEWFKTLPSLFSKRFLKLDTLAEGLVFYHPDGRMAKLRRDMFDWYEGDEHNAT